LRQLEDIFKKIGSEVDNHKFRQQIKLKLEDAGQTLKSASEAIKDFADLAVEGGKFQKEHKDRVKAYEESRGAMMKKL
jgi:hypothetical protein